MKLSSPFCISENGIVNKTYIETGHSFPMKWTPVKGAKSYALLLNNLTTDKVYWMITFIPADRLELSENIRHRSLEGGMIQQKNSFGSIGYQTLDTLKSFRYALNIYALDTELKNVKIGENNKIYDFLTAIQDHVIDSDYIECRVNIN